MMRVLITGATGFSGSHLAEYALAQGAEVFGAAIGGSFTPGVKGRLVDLTQQDAADHLVAEVRPDRLFHLAALVPGSAAQVPPEKLLNVNVLGTLHLLEAVKRHAPTARTLIVSSASVYGPVPPERQPISEDAPLNPVSPYAVSKAMQDLLGGQYAAGNGLHVVRARTFNLIGPREHPGLVAATLARQVAEAEAGRRTEIKARYLFTRRDFTDVRDAARAYWLILEHGAPGAIYNVCSGKTRTIGDLLQCLLAIADAPDATVVERERELGVGDIALSVGNPTHLQADTGWRPAIPLERSLRDLLEEWRTCVKGKAL